MRIENYIKKGIASLIYILISLTLFSQVSENSEILFAGKVKNISSQEEISFAHVYKNSTRMGVICDEWGVFKVALTPGDTLRITAIGYKNFKYILPLSTETDTYKEILLEPITYMLDEVTVYNLGTWEQFRMEFLHMNIEKTVEQKKTDNFNNTIAEAIRRDLHRSGALYRNKLSAMPTSERGNAMQFGLSLSRLFSKAKNIDQIRELKKNLEEERFRARILSRKYNREIVGEITGEKDVKIVDCFMEYVNINSNISYKTTEMEIVKTIKNLYTKFLASNSIKKRIFEQDTTA